MLEVASRIYPHRVGEGLEEAPCREAHDPKNALIPVITKMGVLQVAFIFGGSGPHRDGLQYSRYGVAHDQSVME